MLADWVLVLHALVVLFNVGGAVFIIAGGLRGWRWTQHRGFRLSHVVLIAIVTLEALLGVTCPLTTLENALRGIDTTQSFIGRWLAILIYWDASPWVFSVAYLAFLCLVIWAWLKWPPSA